MSTSFSEHFLNSNQDAADKWQAYLKAPVVEETKDSIPDSLAPLFGSDVFESFSREQIDSMKLTFIRFNAEVIALFEDLFVGALRWRKNIASLSKSQSAQKFSREEFYHGQGFRKFLRTQSCLQYPKRSMLLRRASFIKQLCIWTVRQCPESILIQGAKAETFSLYYSRFVMSELPRESEWRKVNAMHLEDENFHIPFGYEEFDTALERCHFIEKWRLVAYSLLFTVFVQFIMMRGVASCVNESFPKQGWFGRFRLKCKMIKWVVKDFTPYQKTRNHLRAYYKKRRFPFFRLFGVVHFGR